MQSSPPNFSGLLPRSAAAMSSLPILFSLSDHDPCRPCDSLRLRTVAVNLPRRSEIFLLVSRSQRPRNSVVSQLPSMMSALSLYIFLSCVTDCRMAVM